jgi:hypothetical protein
MSLSASCIRGRTLSDNDSYTHPNQRCLRSVQVAQFDRLVAFRTTGIEEVTQFVLILQAQKLIVVGGLLGRI